MTILSLETAKEMYPHGNWGMCEDPRHKGRKKRAIAVIDEKNGDIYAVCEKCLEKIDKNSSLIDFYYED